MAGYHLKTISKGILGQFSKVQEEFEEFIDSYEQQCVIMALVELSDMLGALKYYYLQQHNEEWEEILHYYSTPKEYDHKCSYEQLVHSFRDAEGKADKTLSLSIFLNLLNNYVQSYNLTLLDLFKMSDITQRAFLSGERG